MVFQYVGRYSRVYHYAIYNAKEYCMRGSRGSIGYITQGNYRMLAWRNSVDIIGKGERARLQVVCFPEAATVITFTSSKDLFLTLGSWNTVALPKS